MEFDESIRYYGETPRLAENKILEYFPKDIMIEMQSKGKKYLRLKLTPAPDDTIFNELEYKYGVQIKKYLSDDSCIVEINKPRFDIMVVRDTSRFPRPYGWILRVIEYKQGSDEVDILADIAYNMDHPYGLMMAEHLVVYLNMNKDDLPLEYKEIYTIK